jgi:hypothetical protein
MQNVATIYINPLNPDPPRTRKCDPPPPGGARCHPAATVPRRRVKINVLPQSDWRNKIGRGFLPPFWFILPVLTYSPPVPVLPATLLEADQLFPYSSPYIPQARHFVKFVWILPPLLTRI